MTILIANAQDKVVIFDTENNVNIGQKRKGVTGVANVNTSTELKPFKSKEAQKETEVETKEVKVQAESPEEVDSLKLKYLNETESISENAFILANDNHLEQQLPKAEEGAEDTNFGRWRTVVRF